MPQLGSSLNAWASGKYRARNKYHTTYRKEAVADAIAHELKGADDRLVESLFVGYVVDELCAVHDDHAPAYAPLSTRFCIRDCTIDAPIMFSW